MTFLAVNFISFGCHPLDGVTRGAPPCDATDRLLVVFVRRSIPAQMSHSRHFLECMQLSQLHDCVIFSAQIINWGNVIIKEE